MTKFNIAITVPASALPNLINALPEIMTFLPLEEIGLVLYERKNHLFPQWQPSDFAMDVANLEHFFPGKSYRLGPTNQDHVNVFYSSHQLADPGNIAKLQILMHELDQESQGWFMSGRRPDLGHVPHMVEIFDGLKTDSHFFAPEGFSMNGISGPVYATVHVTPGKNDSYASFVTNTLDRKYDELIGQTIDLFRPGRFSVMLTASQSDGDSALHQAAGVCVPGYQINEKSTYTFDCGHTTVYLNHQRL